MGVSSEDVSPSAAILPGCKWKWSPCVQLSVPLWRRSEHTNVHFHRTTRSARPLCLLGASERVKDGQRSDISEWRQISVSSSCLNRKPKSSQLFTASYSSGASREAQDLCRILAAPGCRPGLGAALAPHLRHKHAIPDCKMWFFRGARVPRSAIRSRPAKSLDQSNRTSKCVFCSVDMYQRKHACSCSAILLAPSGQLQAATPHKFLCMWHP